MLLKHYILRHLKYETRAYALDIDLKIDNLDRFSLGKDIWFFISYSDTTVKLIFHEMIQDSKKNSVIYCARFAFILYF